MNSKAFVLFVLFSLLGFSITAMANECERKIYVSADQIVITEDGILAHIPGVSKPIRGKTLSYDKDGMYIQEWKGPCWIHDLWCGRCGGCGVLLSPMNCSCYD